MQAGLHRLVGGFQMAAHKLLAGPHGLLLSPGRLIGYGPPFRRHGPGGASGFLGRLTSIVACPRGAGPALGRPAAGLIGASLFVRHMMLSHGSSGCRARK